MSSQIEQIIQEIEREKEKVEIEFEVYQNESLKMALEKIELLLKELHLNNSSNNAIVNDIIVNIKNVIKANQDMLSASLQKNIAVLNKMNSGIFQNLNEEISNLDKINRSIVKKIESDIDISVINNKFKNELHLSEDAKYKINKNVLESIGKIKWELLHSVTRTLNYVVEKNEILLNLQGEKQLEEKNKIEIIVLRTTQNKMYTIEKNGDSLYLRDWNLGDSFMASKQLVGQEADELYNNLTIVKSNVEFENKSK